MKHSMFYQRLCTKLAVSLLCVVLPGFVRAQQLEMSSSSASIVNGPSTNPIVSTMVKDNGGSNFVAYTPALTVTASFTQQFSTANGLNFGALASFGSSSLVSTSVWTSMSSISSPSNSMFTSDPYAAAPGTGIDITQNYAFQCFTFCRPLVGQPTNGRYLMGTLTLTFNRVVSDPVLQVVGMGGIYQNGATAQQLGLSTELELTTPGITLTKLTGSTALNVTTAATANTPAGNWKILNSATNPNASSQVNAATGSIRMTGGNITSITFNVYMRGDGGFSAWEEPNATTGDAWLVGISMNEPSVSGHVFNDANGLTDGNVNGTGTNVSNQLYANLVNATGTAAANGVAGTVYRSVPVAADGSYVFQDVAPYYAANYEVRISTVQGTSGAAAPANTLPAGWVHTGSVLGTTGGSNTTPGALSGLTLPASTAVITNANFGIEQLPTANNVTSTSQVNPGGTNRIQVPTLNGSDPEDGTYTGVSNTNTVKITSLPANGTLYYNNVAVTLNQVITNYNPSLLTVDPNDGAITVSFNYQEIDAAGMASADAAVTMPFTTVLISGNVFHDANGLTDNLVAQSGALTTIPSGLFANLVDVATGNVVAATSVSSSTGTYTFTDVNAGNYNIVLSTTQGTVGSAAPPSLLPSGWASTGEHLGAGTGSDGTANGVLSAVAVTNADVTNANFGIERLDAATPASYTIASPALHQVVALTAANGVGALAGTDPEDGAQGSGNTLKITSLSGMNGNVLLYNGSPVTVNTVITNYNPNLLSIRFDGTGITAASFSFVFADAAGVYGTPAAYSVSWAFALPVQLISFDAVAGNKEVDLAWTAGTESGITAYAVLHSTDGAQWEKITEVQAKAEGNYTAVDKYPADGINYYRLQIWESNGTYTYGPVRTVQLRQDEPITVSVYPNPVTSHVTIKMNGDSGNANVMILDAAGRLAGNTTMTDRADIDMSSYAPGFYTIRIINAHNNIAEAKVLKQ